MSPRFLQIAVPVAVATVALTGQVASAAWMITINIGSGLTASQQAAFTTARDFWMQRIVDYKPGADAGGLTISASGRAIDGVNGVLGSAGPTGGVSVAGTVYATTGQMQFDTADLANLEANGSLLSVITHEMGHVLGIGTLWTNNGLYVTGSGRYTGAQALSVWQWEFNQPTATFVPVELDGGSGTANGHWDENPGGSGLTGRVSRSGQDMRDELMTGWLNTPTFVSYMTLGSLRDLGYQTYAPIVVPEPAMLGLAAPAMLLLQRRRNGL